MWLLKVLIVVAVIPVVVGWLIVAITSVQLFLLVPKGQRMAGYNDLGMWRFGRLRERIGPGAAPLVRRMKLGGIAFALGLLATLAVAALGIPFGAFDA